MTNETSALPRVPLRLLPDRYAICTLPPDAPPPMPPTNATIWSLTITVRERSLVCVESKAPENAEIDAGWRAFYLEGPMPFDLAGVLLGVITPISSNGLGVFALSTFDSDLVLIREEVLEAAIVHLLAAGHIVHTAHRDVGGAPG